MKKKIAFCAVAMTLAGCVTMPQTSVITIKSPFDESAAADRMKPGTANLVGTAFLRQAGGGVVTCAGSKVVLLPFTSYAKERLDHIYQGAPQTDQVVYADSRSARHRDIFTPEVAAYQRLVHQATCDAQGEFSFQNISHGRYYLVTRVTWQVGQSPQGGTLATQVHVNSDRVPRKVITR